MKITRYGHSCLLVEDQDKSILIDPGNFSVPFLDPSKLSSLDYLLITHEHFDHMDIPLIKKLIENFPQVEIIAHTDIVKILKKENITAKNEENEFVKFREALHEKMFGGMPMCKNYIFEIFGKLSHPGDSLHFECNTEILAMPFIAPWCSMTESVAVVEKLKPKIVIPIHDGLWKDEALKMFYPRLVEYLKTKEIDFRSLDNLESTEI